MKNNKIYLEGKKNLNRRIGTKIDKESFRKYLIYKINNLRKKDMTYILGAKCVDGVVLVSDTKVTIDEGADYAYSKKLFKPFTSIVMGASGLSGLYMSFQDRMNLAIQNYEGTVSNVNQPAQLSIIAEEVIRGMHNLYQEDRHLIINNLSVIMGMRLGLEAELKSFNGYGIPEPTNLTKPKVIGHGEPYGKIFLENMWKPSMNMEQTAKLGLFVIKVIQDLDKSVGYSDDFLPQVYYIPNIIVSNIKTGNQNIKQKLINQETLNPKELNEVTSLISEQFPIKELEDKEVRHLLDEVSSTKAHLDTLFKPGEFKI